MNCATCNQPIKDGWIRSLDYSVFFIRQSTDGSRIWIVSNNGEDLSSSSRVVIYGPDGKGTRRGSCDCTSERCGHVEAALNYDKKMFSVGS